MLHRIEIPLRLGLILCVCLVANPSSVWGQRALAPGVLTVIPPDEQPVETFAGPRPLVEIVDGLTELEWTPNFAAASDTLVAKAQRAIFRHSVWNLEFAFKPMRMIEADVLQPSGKMQRKRVWYLVYRVSNPSGHGLRPKEVEDRWGNTTYEMETVNFPTRRFFPQFVLRSHEYDKEYLDLPTLFSAQQLIEQRETPGVKLHNSVEITKVPIPLSDDRVRRAVWGVAMWIDVDPRIDFFSVYVDGLTNAFRFEDEEGAFKPGDPPGTGRSYEFKNLQLNFWRPGDSLLEHENEFRFGVPAESDSALQQEFLDKFGLDRRLDYLWVYR